MWGPIRLSVVVYPGRCQTGGRYVGSPWSPPPACTFRAADKASCHCNPGSPSCPKPPYISETTCPKTPPTAPHQNFIGGRQTAPSPPAAGIDEATPQGPNRQPALDRQSDARSYCRAWAGPVLGRGVAQKARLPPKINPTYRLLEALINSVKVLRCEAPGSNRKNRPLTASDKRRSDSSPRSFSPPNPINSSSMPFLLS